MTSERFDDVQHKLDDILKDIQSGLVVLKVIEAQLVRHGNCTTRQAGMPRPLHSPDRQGVYSFKNRRPTSGTRTVHIVTSTSPPSIPRGGTASVRRKETNVPTVESGRASDARGSRLRRLLPGFQQLRQQTLPAPLPVFMEQLVWVELCKDEHLKDTLSLNLKEEDVRPLACDKFDYFWSLGTIPYAFKDSWHVEITGRWMGDQSEYIAVDNESGEALRFFSTLGNTASVGRNWKKRDIIRTSICNMIWLTENEEVKILDPIAGIRDALDYLMDDHCYSDIQWCTMMSVRYSGQILNW